MRIHRNHELTSLAPNKLAEHVRLMGEEARQRDPTCGEDGLVELVVLPGQDIAVWPYAWRIVAHTIVRLSANGTVVETLKSRSPASRGHC